MHSKKKLRFTAALSLGDEGFYTSTFNRLEIQPFEFLVIFQCIPWSLSFLMPWFTLTFCWSNKKQSAHHQWFPILPMGASLDPGPVIWGFHPWSSSWRMDSGRFRPLRVRLKGERFGVVQDASWYPIFHTIQYLNFTTLLDSFQIWFFGFCIVILSNSYIIHVFLNWTSEPSSDDWQNSCKRYTAGTWKWGYFVAFKKASPLPEEGIHFQVNPPFGFPWGS